MKRRRVKITGIGPVTPAGIGREAFWRGILEPVSRVRAFTKLGEEFGAFVAASVPHFDIRRYIDDSKIPKGTARHTLFAVAGALLSVEDATLKIPELRQLSCAIVSGSSLLDFGGIGSAIDSVQRRGARGAKPRVVYTTTLSVIPEVISEVCGITARTMSIQTSCCSGLDAIGTAANMISSGEADLAICGGTESPLHKFPLLELRAAGLTPHTTALPERIARPFDLWRTTGVVSEGACYLVLEADSSPRKGYGYIEGYAFANDPSGELCVGLARAIELAIADARLRPDDIEAINAWAPGHRTIDEAEARALGRVFKKQLPNIPTYSIKGAIGAALGAAPAIQVGVAALAQNSSTVPPTINWEYQDSACPLSLSNRVRTIAHKTTLVNAHGVGNVNSALIVTRW
jgi:3-oxoacyl-[acyl-carrier-protein] synthase II